MNVNDMHITNAMCYNYTYEDGRYYDVLAETTEKKVTKSNEEMLVAHFVPKLSGKPLLQVKFKSNTEYSLAMNMTCYAYDIDGNLIGEGYKSSISSGIKENTVDITKTGSKGRLPLKAFKGVIIKAIVDSLSPSEDISMSVVMRGAIVPTQNMMISEVE